MAIELLEKHDGKILELRVSDKLTKEDYERFVPEVERLIKQHGRLRMLFEMHDFHGWTAGALWQDTKFAWKHFSHIDRLAVVGEKAWQHGMAVFCKPFTAAEVHYFDRDEAHHAHAWLEYGTDGPSQAPTARQGASAPSG